MEGGKPRSLREETGGSVTAHPLEVAFLVLAGLALVESGGLFWLKLQDILSVRRSGQNGPILFAVSDNLRRQVSTVAVCGVLLGLAISGCNNPLELNAQTRNLLWGGVFVAAVVMLEGVFIYRRRNRMALLIATYEGKPGGRRCTDPPALKE